MVEQTDAGEAHGDAVVVAGFNDVVISDGAARLGDVLDAGLEGALHVVAEGEEGVGAHGHAAHLRAERLLLEPCGAGARVHRRVGGDVSPPSRALLRGDERVFDLCRLHGPAVCRQARIGAEPEQESIRKKHRFCGAFSCAHSSGAGELTGSSADCFFAQRQVIQFT